MTVNGPKDVSGGGRAKTYSLKDLQGSRLKKKAPLIEFFKKYDLNNDSQISSEEAMLLLAEHNNDGKAELSKKEFKSLEKEHGDMGRGERKLFNKDFLKNVFGTDDVLISVEDNKKTFKTQDGKFLGTFEENDGEYTFYNEKGAKTKNINTKSANLTITNYNDAGEEIEKQTVYKGLGTEISTKDENGNKVIIYEGDNLIASKKGVVKEKYYTENGTEFKEEHYTENSAKLKKDEYTGDLKKLKNMIDKSGFTSVRRYKNIAPANEEANWVDERTLNLSKKHIAYAFQGLTKTLLEKAQQKPAAEEPQKFNEALEKFGNKVTIDEEESNQRLSSAKQWQTSIKVPNRAQINENGSPSVIQMSLPSSYGKNAYQTLKLVDPENNIYQDKAGLRQFQINITDDGVTLRHINADNAKIKDFIGNNKKSENDEKLKGSTDVANKNGAKVKAEKAPESKTSAENAKKIQKNIATRDINGVTYKSGNSIKMSKDLSKLTMKIGNNTYKISSTLNKYINEDGTFKQVKSLLISDYMIIQGFALEPLNNLVITTKNNNLGVEKNGKFYKLEDIMSGKVIVE